MGDKEHHSEDYKLSAVLYYIENKDESNLRETCDIFKCKDVLIEWEKLIFDPDIEPFYRTLVSEWKHILISYKEFVDKHERKPSKRSSNDIEKRLGIWIQSQKENIKTGKGTLFSKECNPLWIEFYNHEKYSKFI